jgi:hypothetical protein
MTTQAPPMQMGGNMGQSAWHHAVSTYGDMGQQHAGVGNAIAMKGGKRRQSKRQNGGQRQSRKQRQTWGKRQRQSRRQRGGRK